MGLSHLAQSKKKNTEIKNKWLHFSFLTVFSPTRGICIQLRGEENGFCIEMRQPRFLFLLRPFDGFLSQLHQSSIIILIFCELYAKIN